MEFCSLDGAGNGEHSGVGLVETTQIFVTRDTLSMGTGPFGRIYNRVEPLYDDHRMEYK